MSKLIAVWGTPQSGKTTFTVKLANALNLGGKGKSIHSAIAVFPDITTPVVPTVFPNKKDEELYSLGSVLQKPDLTRNLQDVLKMNVSKGEMRSICELMDAIRDNDLLTFFIDSKAVEADEA